MNFKIPYHDLRSWLDLAGELGEVRLVEGASWQEEIGMATELLNHSDPAPAALFDKIPGYPKGYRVLVNFFGGRRKGMTLGLPGELSNLQLSEAFTEAFEAAKPIPYEVVGKGPILENVVMGDDVNVLSFPTPLWHEMDGGRYIGTGSYNITQDPEEGWVNLGTYRVMVHDEKSVGFYISPGKHGRIHRDKYMARKEPMPAAIVLGGDPLLFLMSCTELPYGISEYDIAGGLRGKPYQVIKGKMTGLPIPANAEIVLEGYIDPQKGKPEGPFGEWTGYYGSGVREEPYMDVKAVYYRNNPIMLGCPPQRPPDEISRYRAVLRSGLLKQALGKAGLQGIKAAWASEVGNTRMLLCIAIEQRYGGHATQVGHVAS
ncbi:MAG: UbiD family decarboxylase, partial [Deltaproteobacteria bacterium]|nr:UbiD family decarboxylase [Deltaproteobacteria bacterium]